MPPVSNLPPDTLDSAVVMLYDAIHLRPSDHNSRRLPQRFLRLYYSETWQFLRWLAILIFIVLGVYDTPGQISGYSLQVHHT